MKKILLILLLLVVRTTGFAQISFYKQYSNNGYDYGEGIVQTEDSSYIITGQSSSFIDGPAQAYLLKVDSLGNYLWSWHYGGDESDGGKRVMYIENDGILVAGFTNSFGAGAYDFYLFKTDVSGNELWRETYGTSAWDRVTDAALTSDSGVIMVGQTLNTTDGESDILIVRTDKNGQEIWTQQIGGIGEDVANVIEVMDDSTFIVGGKTFVEDSSTFKALLFKIQDNGALIWKDTLGENGSYDINDLFIEPTKIALVGMHIKPSGDTTSVEMKTFLDGILDFERMNYNPGISYNVGITPFGFSNDYVLVNNFDNIYSYGKLDLGFNRYYNQLYFIDGTAGVNYIGDEILGQLISTSDYGAIAVGSVTEVGNGGSNIFLIKLYPGLPFFNSDDDFSVNSFASISENNVASDFSIYPVPANEVIHIDSKNGEEIITYLFDTSGRLVIERESNDSSEMNVSSLENGVYFLKILKINSKELHSMKIVISH